MSNIDKQALRQKAVKAGGEEWQSRKMPGPAGEYTVIVKGSLEKHPGWTTCRPIADEVIDKKTMDFIVAANPATVLALLDELAAAERRIAELTESHSKLRDTMATIHNTIRMDGGYTPLAAILNAAKRAYEESATPAGIGVKGE
ncbi:ead/Ea22-like family protein [Salmonella enterica]|nr:ead/Ea22-like family protein [Salmonella enterica]ECO5358363.1 ead/Ea22-like family protein [Salmonella enterica]